MQVVEVWVSGVTEYAQMGKRWNDQDERVPRREPYQVRRKVDPSKETRDATIQLRSATEDWASEPDQEPRDQKLGSMIA